MQRTFLLVMCLFMVLLPLGSLAQAPPSQGVEYKLILDCPGNSRNACPIVARDPEDAMGDPSLAVDPDNPNEMIVASLHGLGSQPGAPSPKSRNGPIQQEFTTFTTDNGGASWVDNPFTPPQGVGANAFGEHPALTIDPYGHVFIGSLWSVPQGDDRFEWVISAQKFSDIADINRNQNGNYRAQFISSIYEENTIGQMWFLFNPVTDNMTMVWNEQVTPTSSASTSGARIGDSMTDVLEGRLDAEKAPGGGSVLGDGLLPGAAAIPSPTQSKAAQQSGEAKSVIGVVWTSADMDSSYQAADTDTAIGPCSTSTNPVISENWLYIGCVVSDEGEFTYNPEAVPGDLEMFRMDPNGGEPEYIGPSPLHGGKPKLGVRSDGRLAVMSADVIDGDISLTGAFGYYAEDVGRAVWGGTVDYANRLERLHPSLQRVDANIQDLIYREYSGVLHLILKQEVAAGDDTLDLAADLGVPRYRKAIIAIDEEYGLLAEMDLDIGAPLNRTGDPGLAQMDAAVFNDTADDFLNMAPGYFEYNGRSLGSNYMREYFAVADYGTILFAEIVEITDLRGPLFAPPPTPPPPPIPAAAPAGISAMVPAGAFTVSAIMSGTMMAAKRKHVTGAGPGKKN